MPLRSREVHLFMTSHLVGFPPSLTHPGAHLLVLNFSHTELSLRFTLYYLWLNHGLNPPLSTVRDDNSYWNKPVCQNTGTRSSLFHPKTEQVNNKNQKISGFLRSHLTKRSDLEISHIRTKISETRA